MVRSGFYNSKNHDRLYYNSDMSRLFNSLIKDGVFQNVGDKFIARPGTGMQVIIPSGMAYFNSTWIFNDTDYVQAIDAAPIVAGFSRIDGIFLKMGPVDDQNERLNSIYYMAGTAASQDVQKPVPTATDGEVYVPICYVTVANGTTEITAAMIENCVGTVNCPFITGILETIDATELLTQWEAQWNDWLNAEKTDFEAWAEDRQTAFTEWFENLQYVLDGDVAGHLQQEIDELQPVRKRTITNLIDPSKYVITTSVTQNGITVTNNGDGTFTVNGTTDDNVGADGKIAVNLFSWGSNVVIADGVSQVRLCGVPSDMHNKALIQLADVNATTAWLADTGSGTTINTVDDKLTVYAFRFEFYPNITFDNVVFKPMLTTDLYASYDEFVQYSGDGELNENVSWLYRLVESLQNSFSNALTSLKNTAIAQAVGATGSTFTSVIAKLGDIVNRGAWTANMANTGSVTIPAGYHDGTGTVKTSGTATITTNGTHDIAQYSSATVNVPNNNNMGAHGAASTDLAQTGAVTVTRSGYAYAVGTQRIDPGKTAYVQIIVNGSVRAQANYTQPSGYQTGAEATVCWVNSGESVYAKCGAQYSGYSCGVALVVPMA